MTKWNSLSFRRIATPKRSKMSHMRIPITTVKASANKNAFLVFAF